MGPVPAFISWITIPDGVRISIFDKAQEPVFKTDSAEFTDFGRWVVSTLAWQVARYTNSFRVELEGHTESGHQFVSNRYTGWELSADRANAGHGRSRGLGRRGAIRAISRRRDRLCVAGADRSSHER